ncbi:MAG TPA: iron uptake porin, partial [Allocoleopsis sp.]
MTSTILWKIGLATPTLVGTMLVVSLSAMASEVQPLEGGAALSAASSTTVPSTVDGGFQVAQVATPQTNSVTPSTSNQASIDEILNYNNDNTTQAQVTSISQLSDVQPSDWAFQALQSLVERYGCIAGYPDGTYRGQSALTRFEFAAGLNACLDRISEL